MGLNLRPQCTTHIQITMRENGTRKGEELLKLVKVQEEIS
jgi:hypothetical protein